MVQKVMQVGKEIIRKIHWLFWLKWKFWLGTREWILEFYGK
jgi:hypothetical protein